MRRVLRRRGAISAALARFRSTPQSPRLPPPLRDWYLLFIRSDFSARRAGNRKSREFRRFQRGITTSRDSSRSALWPWFQLTLARTVRDSLSSGVRTSADIRLIEMNHLRVLLFPERINLDPESRDESSPLHVRNLNACYILWMFTFLSSVVNES